MRPHEYRRRDTDIGLDILNFFLPEPLAFLESSDVSWIQFENDRKSPMSALPTASCYSEFRWCIIALGLYCCVGGRVLGNVPLSVLGGGSMASP